MPKKTTDYPRRKEFVLSDEMDEQMIKSATKRKVSVGKWIRGAIDFRLLNPRLFKEVQ